MGGQIRYIPADIGLQPILGLCEQRFLDISSMESRSDMPLIELAESLHQRQQAFRRLQTFPKPVIARIRGVAVGAGQAGVRVASLYEQGAADAAARRDVHQALAAKDAEQAVNAKTVNPSGTLRIMASLSFAMHHVAPILREYTQRYPLVNVHVEAANRYQDMIDDNIDVAIRTREFEPDSNITIRRLAETRRVLAASPRYLAQHGFPKSLDDLQRHKLLIYTYANTPNDLRFQRDGQVTTVHAKGLLESNDGQILRSAALEGLGILVQPSYIVYEDIVAGRLVPLLEDWDLPRLTINLAYPNRKHLSAKVRTFVDFMAERFLAQGFERKWTTRFSNPS